NSELVERLGAFLAEPVRQAVALRLELPPPEESWCDEAEFLRALWDVARTCLTTTEARHLGRIYFLLRTCLGASPRKDGGSPMSEKSHLKGDEILKAIRWKLDIASDKDPLSPRYWDLFCSIQHSRAYKSHVARVFGELMRDAVLMELGVKVDRPVEEQHLLMDLWKAYKTWFNSLRAPNPYSGKVSELICQQLPSAGIKLAGGQVKPAQQPAGQAQTRPSPAQQALPADGKGKTTQTGDASESDVLTVEPADSIKGQPANASDRPPVAAGWRFKPAPADEPDAHSEDDKKWEPLPDSSTIIAARVGGKKHKHEGTHCDDWFEVRHCPPWVLIAVSDGGGSYRLSRVGARVSCQAAVESLAADLKDRPMKTRSRGLLEEWFNWEKETGLFSGDDKRAVEGALHKAMNAAYEAVRSAAAERAESPAHQKLLGRKPAVEDLSATLLLAACTTLKVKGADYSFMATCSVGDGLMAAVTTDGDVQLLSTPDGGEHASETYFLTSKGRLDPKNLSAKTFVGFRPTRALMVMTDGVADDYFPAQTEMLRLYADLVLNRVLPAPASNVLTPDCDAARAA